MNQKQSKSDELFFVVDAHDQPLAPLPRKLVHGHGVWHRVSHVIVFNDNGQILCHQRSLQKELDPGFWALPFGGHLAPGETYRQGALRELGEEVGIKDTTSLKLWKIYAYNDVTGYNNEFQAVFTLRWNGSPAEVTFDDGEVTQVAWKGIDDTIRILASPKHTNWAACGYEIAALKDLQH